MMKAEPKKNWNFTRLDAAAFARESGSHHDVVALASLPRLAAERWLPDDGHPVAEPVSWKVQGELRAGQAEGEFDVWLHLEANATLPLTCQRCLGPVATPLLVDRWFRFVADEATAAELDADCEEDLMPLEPRPDLLMLLEDELLMSLPLVSLHETCPLAVPMASASEGFEEALDERPNPFAALAQLKKGR